MQDILGKYTSKIREYKSARSISTDFEVTFSPAEDYSTIMKDAKTVMMTLESVTVKFEAEPGVSTATPPPSVDRNNLVKLQKA